MRPIFLPVVVAVLLTGCSREPDSKDAADGMRENRSVVLAEVRAAAKALTNGDTRAVGIRGGYQGCGGGGTGALEVRYRAGGRIEGGTGTTKQRAAVAMELLEAAGWTVTDGGPSAPGGAYGRLVRDGLELSVDEDPLKGSDAIVFGAHSVCGDVTDEQYTDLPGDEAIVP